MQSTLVICASQPGILYLNGSFAGEAAPDEPVIRPVAPRGAVYMDYRPLSGGYLPVTRKIVFSGGKPMPVSVENAEDIGAILWPGNICEIEITPPAFAARDARSFTCGGRSFSIRGEIPKLYCGKQLLGTLPEGASIPRMREMDEGFAFTGSAGGLEYILTADSMLKSGTGFLSADKIAVDADGIITATLLEDDIAGHATTERWRLTAEGLELLSSEAGWAGGSAKHPQTAQQTALAAVQAALMGNLEEAEAFLSEELAQGEPFADIIGKYELCTDMKYAHPDNRPCIALIRLENEHMAIAEPLYYSCEKKNGAFSISRLEFMDR
ncbi:MAG: hypothetical protein IJA26_03195 [Clostridia bacterium]|nr:hypothetical protein [Clostridia bacterium]